MENCKHEILTLVIEKSNKVRCRHCHLTISEDELENGYCPECMEAHNVRHCDFDKVSRPDSPTTRYYCENCGIIIECR
ncbi:MAG: hypothetical protein K9L30_14900 [Desulfobacterales bacterium]|nr:hypothetical protein [Desulfobacterales bacterium]